MIKHHVSVLALGFVSTPVLADIVVEQAMITSGELRVVGRLNPARSAEVALDDKAKAATDSAGRFYFRLAYHPADCVVSLKAGAENRQAIVGFCGQRGPEGPSGALSVQAPAPIQVANPTPKALPTPAAQTAAQVGPRGPQGVAGPQGPEGPQGQKGDKGDKGERGEKGDKGDRGEKGEPGAAGLPGPAGPAGAQGPAGPEGKPSRAGSGLRVQLETCATGGRCVASCKADEFAVSGTCSGGERPAMDETSIYCFSVGATSGPLKARAICAKQ